MASFVALLLTAIKDLQRIAEQRIPKRTPRGIPVNRENVFGQKMLIKNLYFRLLRIFLRMTPKVTGLCMGPTFKNNLNSDLKYFLPYKF
jgi:hypothetical protein